jgi:para-aminobenzoate synthetase component 1
METSIIRNRINYLASAKRPFLFAVDFELSDGFLIENPLQQEKVLFRTPLASNTNKGTGGAKKNNISLSVYPEPYEVYKKRLSIVLDALKRGDSFLTNLTVKTAVDTSLSLREIFDLSIAPYCLYVPGKFVCFSPERFVHVKEGIISTNPMKGTINMDISDAENIILNDTKETEEHNTIVDLLRNDLGMVAEDIRVTRFRYIDRVMTAQRDILQVSSEITGQLGGEYLSKLGDIIFKMLPAGSVSGAPKRSTIDIIKRAEGIPRGYYTGIFGYFDGEEFDSAVMIRFIEEDNGKKYFRSGGGITVSSEPQYEYKEVMEKIYLPFV